MKRILNVVLTLSMVFSAAQAQLGGVGYYRGNAPGFKYATIDLQSRMTDIWSGQRKQLFNRFYRRMWSQAVWQKMDVMYLFAAHAQQPALLNVIKRSHNATAVNSPTFAANRGFTGNGTSSYINSNYNANSQAVNYSLNSATIGAYVTGTAVDAGTVIGASSDAVNWAQIVPRFTGDITIMRLNSGASSTHASTNASGWWTIDRAVSTEFITYRNGALFATQSTVSSTVPDANFYILARNVGGTASAFFSLQTSAVLFGGSLSASQQLHLNNAVETYWMDPIGAGVQ